MRPRFLPALSMFALTLFGALPAVAAEMDHSAMPALVPVDGEPGVYTVETARGPLVVRAATRSAVAVPDKTVNVTNFRFEADGLASTQIDTVKIDVGQTVRWHLLGGIHTVTNGQDGSDPEAGVLFNAAPSLGAPDFDFTFSTAGTYPYFCVVHELFNMKGVVVVTATAGVPDGPAVARTGFARPPAPNPARGSVAFAVGMVRGGEATVEVLDAAGRRVATVHRGSLPAGEHQLRWDGRANDGRVAAAGVYRVRLRAEGLDDTRAFTLLR